MRRGLRAFVRFALVAAVLYGMAGFLTSRLVPGPEPITPLLPGPADVQGPAAWRLDPASDGVASWVADRGVEVRGAQSVHSGRSHDAEGTLDEVASAADRAGLDFVLLGDHPAPWLEEPGALDPRRTDGVLLVPGQEMVVAGTGRLLVVGLENDTLVERWDRGVAELAERVEAAGGYLSVVHPRSPRGGERWRAGIDAPGVDAWEALDVSEMARLRLADRWAGYHLTAFLAGLVTGTAQGPVLRLNREGVGAPGLVAYDSARSGESLTLTAALNHHPKARILGRLVPGYTPFFRTLTNHVLLDEPLPDDPVTARAQLLRGLRSGRVFVSFGGATEAEGFTWGLLPRGAVEDGGAFEAGVELLGVRLPPETPGRFLIHLLRNGGESVWFEAEGGDVLAIRPPGPGSYRLEVHRAGTPVGSWRYGMRPWILSNPVDLPYY